MNGRLQLYSMFIHDTKFQTLNDTDNFRYIMGNHDKQAIIGLVNYIQTAFKLRDGHCPE